MKLQRIMLAVLAVCGTSAALAQSSVTLYGRVNTTVENWKIGSGKSTTGLNSNSSFVGFRGTEDLGGGLKAGFQLEALFRADTGAGGSDAGINFNRHSELNLSGKFGTVRLGTFNAASYLATADYISMHNHDTGLSADMLYAYTMRETNKIAYVTPAFGGFTAEVQHSFHEKAAIRDANGVVIGQDNKNAWDLAVNYGNGPLGVGLGYSRSPFELNGLGSDKAQQLTARVSYAIGALVLGGYYQYAKLDDVFGTADAKRNAYRLSAMYTMGASEFHANVGRADKMKLGSSRINGSAATQWTLGYNYNLSKRTKVYGYYTKIDNGAAASYFTGSNGDDLRSLAVGVRHLF